MVTQGANARLGERAQSKKLSKTAAAALCVAALAGAASPVRAVVSNLIDPSTGFVPIVNLQVGADTWYNNGYFGQRSVIANVEAGLVWDGHETTSQKGVTYFYDPSTFQTVPGQPEYDSHATAVGFTLAGLGPPVTINGGTTYYYYQLGIAPGANLWSAGVATTFNPGTGQFDVSAQTLRYAYQTVDTQSIFRVAGGNLYISSGADVLNSSWGFTDPSGSDGITRLLDAVTYTYHKTLVIAAGNTENAPPVDPVGGPASGFNSISVGALTNTGHPGVYNEVASFSNAGPIDFYNPKTGVTIPGVRCGVDIAAPGENLILAAYTGNTGGNTGITPPNAPPLPTDLYYFGAAGTSFASPIVAGGASLIADAGWANFGGGNSIDGRVIKAVLLNSADKIPGWNNGQHPDINGVITTTQSLDYSSGAGALNLTQAYTQYLGGTTDVPGTTVASPVSVLPIGWDYASVTNNAPNDYAVNATLKMGDKFTVTLDWFVQKTFTDATAVDPTVPNTATDVAFFNLDLQVWEKIDNTIQLVAQSDSLYNNTEHLYFDIPKDGSYFIRVLMAGTIYDIPGNTLPLEYYGLAWSDIAPAPVPEPASLLLLVFGVHALACGRRRRRSH